MTDHAQLPAQLGAQLSPEPEHDSMALHASHLLAIEVLGRHNITQNNLARAINRSTGQVSRILQGDGPVPAEMLAYLWQATGDPAITAYLGEGPEGLTLLPVTPRTSQLASPSEGAALACGCAIAAAMRHQQEPHYASHRAAALERIDEAFAALMALRSEIELAPTARPITVKPTETAEYSPHGGKRQPRAQSPVYAASAEDRGPAKLNEVA